MIHVDRKKLKLPAGMNRVLNASSLGAAKFFKRPPEQRSQERYAFKEMTWKQMRKPLEELFHNKCAYCEWSLEPGEGLIEHFRPKIEAVGLDGKSDPDWYSWLAYRPDNLFIACKTCNANKRNHFPVLGKRASVGSVGRALGREIALLLDPCIDRPELYLQFQDDGTVRPILPPNSAEQKRLKGYDRGEMTIKVIGLNRSSLIEARRSAAEEVKFLYGTLLSATEKWQPEDLKRLYDSAQPYAATRRQVAARLIQQTDDRLLKANVTLSHHLSLASKHLVEELRFQPKPKAARRPRQMSATLYETAYLQRIEIKNFRAIQDLSLKFTQAPETGTTWKMLLGENGAGKSSVLKAVALVMMGKAFYSRHGKELGLEPGRIFNRKTKQKDGLIRLELSKGVLEVRFTKTALKFVHAEAPLNIFLRGYGATRLLSPRQAKDVQGRAKDVMNVENLFKPFAHLGDADNWLVSLDKDQFDSAGLTLKDLLHLAAIRRPLTKKGNQVYLDVGHGPMPLNEQSDGYQSVLALVTDIMAGVPGALRDKQQASGIVLLDEIDAHLHPRWKMKIVRRLRQAFPNIQFLATTHEPLCLKGLGEREIAVMQRTGNRITVRDDIPSPAELRIDQLLTSELFGLYSTIDDDIDAKFQEYYELLAKHRLSQKQTATLERLKGELKRYNKLGYTRRDQLVYEVIDEFLSKEGHIDNLEERRTLRNETKKRVAEIWMNILAQREIAQ